MGNGDKQEIIKRINHIEKILMDDRIFFVKMMIEIKKLFECIDNFLIIDDSYNTYLDDTHQPDRDNLIKELMTSVATFKEIKEELDKYGELPTLDQFGES